MELHVTIAVLFAALFHAAWNSIIKGGCDPLLDSMLLSLSWVFICAAILPFLPIPHPDSWLFAAVTVIVHLGYIFLLSKSYQIGDMSRVYPIVRGLPPMIIALVSFFVLGEQMSFYGWVGVVTISLGILVLEFGHKSPPSNVLLLSIATACMIAVYTIVDGVGARLSGHSTSFLLWFTLVQSVIFIALVIMVRGRARCGAHMRKYWKRGSIGGVLSLLSYGIVLWAITQAPIGYVAALRESAVLFGGVIAVLFLSEKVSVVRVISTIIILCGIIVMQVV